MVNNTQSNIQKRIKQGSKMFRSVENDLVMWKDHPNRKPLLIRGARQVGKSFIVEKIGADHFEKQVTINF